jgi:hypothetical protein
VRPIARLGPFSVPDRFASAAPLHDPAAASTPLPGGQTVRPFQDMYAASA